LDKWPKEFGDFEIISWKKHSDTFFNRILRIIEFKFALLKIKKIIKRQQPDMIAERTTSWFSLYRCKTRSGCAQQGRTIYGRKFYFTTVQKIIQNYAFKTLIHAWGPV
jgi:hypothetical protein